MLSKRPPWAPTHCKQRRRRHWLMAAIIEWFSFLHSTNHLSFSLFTSARHQSRYWKKTCQVRVSHRLHCKCNCSCLLSWLGNKSSKFYKISKVLNKIMQKFSLALFFWCNVLSQSAMCSTCIIPALPVNCQFIWMACAFGMSATQPILGWL